MGVDELMGVPAVFLDRDGVLNRALVRDGRPGSPATVEEMEILPGVRQACLRLRAAGFALVVITNQPDIARGRLAWSQLRLMHEHLGAVAEFDAILVCPHDDADHCGCRKPAPGMVREAERTLGIDVAASVVVGDRWSDIALGGALGCRTVLIGDGYGEPGLGWLPDLRAPSLSRAAEAILTTRPIDQET
ncbi:D-glycero-alpha-D-manno-heptose-1,7-bisphosphate 7-phosphatase [Nocardia takedensis]